MNTTAPVLVLDAAPGVSQDLNRRLKQRGFSPILLNVADAGACGEGPLGAELAVVLVDAAEAAKEGTPLAGMLHRLVAENVPTVVWGAKGNLKSESGPLVEWVPSDVGLDEVAGKVGTLARYVPLVKGLERELKQLRRLGEQLNRYFGEIDQEMRLAGRMQRDFLPRELPRVPPLIFELLYRPASWVSGDMYDVFRIDEHHFGVFVADAMGHGVAAGLVTMFLRQALVSKLVTGNTFTIVPPSEALTRIHECLLRQKLPNSQFVTAAYGIIDTRSGECRLARAGHPYPLHIRPDGSIQEVRASGSLLGLPDVPVEFEETRFTVRPGDKLVFYTDGIEDVIVAPGPRSDEPPGFTPELTQWAGLHAAEFMKAVADHLDRREGSLHPADDITLLLLEVAT